MGEAEPPLPAKDVQKLKDELKNKQPKESSVQIAGGLCVGATCPRMFMFGVDWMRCWGEVFRMYRPLGPGPIVSGDYVGLFYARSHNLWFSLFQNRGRKLPCPGIPSSAYGLFEKTLQTA